MKKIYFFLFLIAFVNFSSFAQHSWSGYGDRLNSSVYSIVPDANGDFYIGGSFTVIGTDSIGGIAKWNGTKFSKLGLKGITGSKVAAMLKYNGGIVAAGSFSRIDTAGCHNIGFWNGLKWAPMGSGLDYTGATTVSTLTVYNDDLYAAGTFSSSGNTTVNNIAKWNGSSWVALGTGLNGPVKAMCVYNGDLYVAGTFTTAGSVSVHNIARWNGSSWHDLDGGLEYTGATTVSTLHVFNGNLYAGGNFNTAGGESAAHIAKWDGTSWTDIGSGMSYTGATTVSTLCIHDFDGKLIAEAKYRSVADTNIYLYHMQSWNDTAWAQLDAKTNFPVNTLQVVDGSLFAGGDFTQIASDSVFYLAQWATSSIRSMAFETAGGESTYNAGNVYPNPVKDQLYFSSAKASLNYSIIVSDLLGRTICSKISNNGSFSFKEENIKPGVYIYRICDGSGIAVKQGKIIFE
ncbi:MAG: hypothetical protein JWO09_2249 [Bacteroidetes bacterium]|nr:hypothetical protein [Bacteroidota bacterium]